MDILFKRAQTAGKLSRVAFQLWSKVELNEDEQALVKRYRFDEAVLIDAFQPKLLRNAGLVGLVAAIVAYIVFDFLISNTVATFLALIAGVVAGYWFYHDKRETIFVRDLLHGRHFTCDSVIELARKEAWLTTIVSYLRQVMESAKHWDGTERHSIEPLPKDEARQVILRGI